MKRLLTSFLLAITLVACGDDGGTNMNPDIDAPGGTPDASIDAPPAPMMITLSGTAVERSLQGTQPVADALIEGFRNSDETTPIASAMTDAAGNFTLVVTTGGEALAGYLKASKAGNPPMTVTYLYPAAPIATDTAMIPINMLSESSFGLFDALAGVQQQMGNGVVGLVVVDGPSPQAMPVAGATVDSNPAGDVRYAENGTPSANATMTAADGLAFIFNLPPGPVTVSAMKTGSTFQSHGVKAWADAITTTFVTP